MNHIYEQIQKEIQCNQAVVLTTKLSLKNEGKIEEFERTIYTEEQLHKLDKNELYQVLKEGKPTIIKQSTTSILAEPFYPKERLIVLGGGHIAIPLVEIASRVGFDVTVIDDRPSFANSVRFPTAEKVICESFQTCFERIQLTRNDYIVIITRGHRHDTECLRQIMKEPEGIYVGMIGSRKRVSIVKKELEEEGFDKDRLNRVCTPIGLSIGAATPEEISVSIVAQLIQRKRLDQAESFLVNRSDVDSYVLEKLASLEKVPCCLVTIIQTKGSVPRGVGSKMLVYRTGEIVGSIGGGCSESAIMRTAIELIGTDSWLIQDIDMTLETAEEEGMVCGGIMSVLLEDIR